MAAIDWAALGLSLRDLSKARRGARSPEVREAVDDAAASFAGPIGKPMRVTWLE